MSGMGDDPRDPLDETLARGLGALAPSEFELDADRALGAMRPALRRARTRRRVAASTSVLGVFVLVAAGAAVLQHHPDSRIKVQSHAPSTPSTIAVPRPPATHALRSDPTSTTKPSVSPTSTAPNVMPTTAPAAHTTLPVVAPTTTLRPPTGTTAPARGHGGSTTTTTIAAAPATTPYSSTGGRVTITFANGRLTLDTYRATAGYSAEVHTNTPSEIEVRFTSNADGHGSRIRVRVQDGHVQPEIKHD